MRPMYAVLYCYPPRVSLINESEIVTWYQIRVTFIPCPPQPPPPLAGAPPAAMAGRPDPPPPFYFNSFPPHPTSTWAQIARNPQPRPAAPASTSTGDAAVLAAGAAAALAARAGPAGAAEAAARVARADPAAAGAEATVRADPATAEAEAVADALAPTAGLHGSLTDALGAADATTTAAYARGAAAAIAVGLGMPLDAATLPSELLMAVCALSRGLAAGPSAAAGAGGTAPFPAPPPPPVTHRPDSTILAALVTARATAAEGWERVREAALAWERERDAADALARQIAEAEQFLGILSSPDVGTTSSGSAAVIWHDPADPLVAQLHYQAGGVQNIRHLVPGILEPESPSYARWRDLVLITLRRYTLDDHVLLDTAGAVPTPSWLRLDSIVLSWILGTISLDLHDLVRNTPSARGAWLALEGQFLGNAKARALRLDGASAPSSKGDLSVSEFCHQMKGMADSLG